MRILIKNIMELIRAKIAELLVVSNTTTDLDCKQLQEKMKRQNQIIDELKALAKVDKTYVGRIVQFPVADSYALYVVTDVKSKIAEIHWIDYCDGWIDDRCGKECTIDLKFVIDYVNHQDSVEDFFAKRNENHLK
jgi:hypothetical protein